jgi:hypothetical protein
MKRRRKRWERFIAGIPEPELYMFIPVRVTGTRKPKRRENAGN